MRVEQNKREKGSNFCDKLETKKEIKGKCASLASLSNGTLSGLIKLPG